MHSHPQNRYFPEFEALIGSVEEALADFATHAEALFGFYLKHLAAPAAEPAVAA